MIFAKNAIGCKSKKKNQEKGGIFPLPQSFPFQFPNFFLDSSFYTLNMQYIRFDLISQKSLSFINLLV